MNPLLAIITALAGLKTELRDKFNAKLAGLGPIEQVEGSQAVIGVIREVDWAAERIKRVGEELDGSIAKASEILATFEKESGEKAIAAALTAGTHFTAEAHTTALDEAVTKAKDEAKTNFDAQLNAAKLVFDRRSEAITELAASAATLTDDDLAATDYKDRVKVLADRKATLAAAFITEETKPKAFESLMAHGVDEAGKSAFNAAFEILKEAAGGEFKASAEVPPGPKSPGGANPSPTGEKKKAVI